MITIALREGNLYQVTFTEVCEVHVANVAQTSTIDGALELWHHRLDHLYWKQLENKHMKWNNYIN